MESDDIVMFDEINYFRAEQEWRIENMRSQIELILDKLLDIKLALILREPCPPPQQFDPLRTIGKY